MIFHVCVSVACIFAQNHEVTECSCQEARTNRVTFEHGDHGVRKGHNRLVEILLDCFVVALPSAQKAPLNTVNYQRLDRWLLLDFADCLQQVSNLSLRLRITACRWIDLNRKYAIAAIEHPDKRSCCNCFFRN